MRSCRHASSIDSRQKSGNQTSRSEAIKGSLSHVRCVRAHPPRGEAPSKDLRHSNMGWAFRSSQDTLWFGGHYLESFITWPHPPIFLVSVLHCTCIVLIHKTMHIVPCNFRSPEYTQWNPRTSTIYLAWNLKLDPSTEICKPHAGWDHMLYSLPNYWVEGFWVLASNQTLPRPKKSSVAKDWTQGPAPWPGLSCSQCLTTEITLRCRAITTRSSCKHPLWLLTLNFILDLWPLLQAILSFWAQSVTKVNVTCSSTASRSLLVSAVVYCSVPWYTTNIL